MKKVFDMYCDCGHGWCKVEKKLLDELCICYDITRYSYMKGDYAYLEEDCDLSTFYYAYKNKYGVEPKFNTHYSEHSKIRNYEHYWV